MTTKSPPPETTTAGETLDLLLHHILPSLLITCLSTKSLISRWRLLHSKLSLLFSSLSTASSSPHSSSNPLFIHLLPNLLSTVRSLESLSSRCLNSNLPNGKLHLQSDLDIATASISRQIHDLDLLLRSGLLSGPKSQSLTAIVLSVPSASAPRADISLFIRDIFTRLQIGALDLKIKALDSLLQFLDSDPPKLAPLVAQECGDVSSLIRLLEPSSHSLIRDSAASVVSLLATASASSRRVLFDEGVLGPLLRLLDTGSLAVKEKAVAAIEAIAADSTNAWAVAAYGGITILINCCRPGSGSPVIQSLAAASLNYISAIDDLRVSITEEGAIPVLIGLLTSSAAAKNAALCIWSLAAFGGEAIRVSIVEEGGLQNLLRLLQDSLLSNSDQDMIENILRAIHALSFSSPAAKALCSSAEFLVQLRDLIRCGNAATQLAAAAVLSNCSLSDEIKRVMAPSMAALVKMMEFSKPESAQELAARVLVSLLTVKSNRKDLVRDEKCLMQLAQMLDFGREEICKKFPVSVVLALAAGGGGGCRRRLGEAGVCSQLQRLADADVPGARKAMQRIAGGRFKNIFSFVLRE